MMIPDSLVADSASSLYREALELEKSGQKDFDPLAFAWAYYMWGPAVLGVCEGVSHPSENASAFLLLVINLLLVQNNFMDNWPGYKLSDKT